jgi:hypothetical protein
MHEEDWGHFIDLEIGQPLKETAIQNKSQLNPNSKPRNDEPPPPNTRPPKQKKEIQQIITKKLNNSTVIYEEEIWYTRDEEDDSDYGNNWSYIYEAPKEKINKRKEYINNVSFAIYCFICMYFISASSLLPL